MAAPMSKCPLLSKVIYRCPVRHVPSLSSLKHQKFARNSSTSPSHFEKRIFSGIQPTGVPHIGNYLGAIRPWVELQNSDDGEGEIILSVVDLHSITVPQDPQVLRQNIFEMVACLLACGIDPQRTLLFQQSAISEHSELAWVLGCLTSMPRLQHLPQWKDKSSAMKEVPLGLFTYPVLQAADILLYKATHVPVGDDQVKHIELARDLAKQFNKKYGNTFPRPKPIVSTSKRIRSLRSPESKMSKSEPDSRSRIDLTDSPEDITAKLRKAVTDTGHELGVTFDPSVRPGVSNLVTLHASCVGLSVDEVVEACASLDTLQYKTIVADILIETLGGIRDRYQRLVADRSHLDGVLADGNRKAKEIAAKNYEDVKRKVGLL